ncbi:hypothetical protein [Actinomyces howellii]|uniref:hypothetical protein n=1 Tax=Actinomyces howellii TaxID=52771 RepID=UPI000F81F0E5|nr:hypothetical protein [Actinomyces howellii]
MSTRKRFLVLFLVASIVGAGAWWQAHRTSSDDGGATTPATACELFSIDTIEKITGREVVEHSPGNNESSFDTPNLSCGLRLDGLGDIRVTYTRDPWFLTRSNTIVDEERFLSFPSDYGWTLESLNLAREGTTYLSVVDDKSTVRAYAAWYAAGPRTLSLGVFDQPTVFNSPLSDAEIRGTTIALFTYLVETVEERYPATAQPTPPLATASAR